MAEIKLKMKVKIAWWLKPYSFFLACMSKITGREPDYDKFTAMALKAMKVDSEWSRMKQRKDRQKFYVILFIDLIIFNLYMAGFGNGDDGWQNCYLALMWLYVFAHLSACFAPSEQTKRKVISASIYMQVYRAVRHALIFSSLIYPGCFITAGAFIVSAIVMEARFDKLKKEHAAKS